MLRRYGLPYGPGLSRLSTAPDWVFRHPTYEGWLENENPCVLWITGRLGCGKSTLSTSIVEALRGKELVCYHFFGPEDPRQQTAHAFIRGFLHQIISSSKDLLECFSDKYGARGEPLLDDLEELWAVCSSCLRILEQHNTIILVLDGLEKCVEKELKAVLRYLSDIIGLVTCQIKVIVTSNAHVLIRDSLGYIAKKKDRMIFQTIDHDDDQVLELVEHAVHRYIDLTIAELPALSKWTQEQHEQLGSILKDRADGTYLWVSMILRAIPSWGDTSEQNLEKLLWDVPADLGQTYTTMFNLLPEQSSMRSDLFKILLGALEPLSLLQLRDCLTASSCVTFKDQPLEKNLSKRRQPDIERTIKIFCGSFVHITDGFCYFAHSTAREFIFEKISGKEYSVRYLCNSIIVGSIERYIWLLHLLEFSPFTRSKSRSLSGKHSVKDLRQRCSILTEKYPFLVYFRRHWFKYVLFIAGQPSGFRKLLPGAGPGSLKPDLVKLSLKRFTESPFLRVWWFIKMFYMTGAHDTAVVDIAQISGAHLRAYYGFDLSESDCERVTSLPVLGYNLLHCAVLGKQQPTVSWLLKTMTSSPYQMDAWKRTPLHLAASRNAIELVEMLMIYPSTLEAQDYNYETPLDYAESCGLTDTAAILHSWREYIQAEEQTGGSLPYSKIYLYFQDFAQVSGHDFSRRTIDHIESLIWEETDDQEVEEMSRALIKIHNEEPFEYSPSNARFRSRSSDSNLMQHDRSQSRGSSIDSVSRHLRRHRSSRSRRGSTGSGSSSDSSGLKRSSSRGSSIDSVRRI
ncbi:MAG: hypothetical protein LQ342_001228 [Letrouitia transgressa]|nr:MAG: hypothetical protein LQ342_001228 [Letrouitia transgressa]